MAALISPDMKVELALSRYPHLLEVFVRHGFAPLRNPLLRRTFAPLVTIRGAAKMKQWDEAHLAQFLAELEEQASRAGVPTEAPDLEAAVLFDLQDVEGLARQRIIVSPERITVENRGLEPPEPMVRILGLVQQLAEGQRLEALNDRQPKMLFPKLDELGFSYQVAPHVEGGYLITISRSR